MTDSILMAIINFLSSRAGLARLPIGYMFRQTLQLRAEESRCCLMLHLRAI